MPQCKLATDRRAHTQIWSGISASLLDEHQCLTIFFGTVAISDCYFVESLSSVFLHNAAHEQPSQLSVKTKLSTTDLSSVLYTCSCCFFFFFFKLCQHHIISKKIRIHPHIQQVMAGLILHAPPKISQAEK